ncbi:MAG: hypothetical protein ACMXYL_04080 [Candidatus Woesearchaeota archaeon]
MMDAMRLSVPEQEIMANALLSDEPEDFLISSKAFSLRKKDDTRVLSREGKDFLRKIRRLRGEE